MTSQVIDIMIRSMDDDTMSTHIQTAKNSGLLTTSLQVNIGFSTTSGLLLILGAPWLDDLLGPAPWVLAGVGAGLLTFAVMLLYGGRRAPLATARMAVAADLAWVAGTIALAPLVGASFTTIGKVVAVVVAFVVLILAIAEVTGLREALR